MLELNPPVPEDCDDKLAAMTIDYNFFFFK